MTDDKQLTLGSLFSGSGGFELGGLLEGVKPVWSSEIEPFCRRVTTVRMPEVEQLGNIQDIHGGVIMPVYVVTFGSPCQDLSVAGKRAGIENGARSSLFFEAARVIREMREATDGKYPRYAVWENVPGAFTSNGGEDFRLVLETLAQIAESDIHIPEPPKGKWPDAGELLGDGYSIAWRILDAQFFSVPQRRRRIYLVADFGGGSAGNVLFDSESLSGNLTKSQGQRQGIAGEPAACTGKTGIGFDRYNGTLTDDIAHTLPATGGDCVPMVFQGETVLNDQGGERIDITNGVTSTLRAEAHHPPIVAGFCTEHSADARGIGYQEEVSPTLRTGVVPAALYENHAQDSRYTGPLDVAPTVLSTYGTGGNNQSLVAFGISSNESEAMKSDNPHSGVYEASTARTLDTRGGNPACNQGGIAVVEKTYDVRLTSDGTKNTRSNIYETDVARTLDTGGNFPDSNQGGVAVVTIEGNGTRPSHQGSGYSENGVSYTLNATEVHSVAYGIDRAAYNQSDNAKFGCCIEEEVEPPMVSRGPGAVATPTQCMTTGGFMRATEEVAPTLAARDYKDPPVVMDEPIFHSSRAGFGIDFTDAPVSSTLISGDYKGPPSISGGPDYIVRRLMPIECARLQGFPDGWTDGLAIENPTDEDIDRWMEVFETWRKATSPDTKPKTRNQVRKWLKQPYSDSAAYRMWGNGVALPCVRYVLRGIAYWSNVPDYLL